MRRRQRPLVGCEFSPLDRSLCHLPHATPKTVTVDLRYLHSLLSLYSCLVLGYAAIVACWLVSLRISEVGVGLFKFKIENLGRSLPALVICSLVFAGGRLQP
jgi:hypothetical protein